MHLTDLTVRTLKLPETGQMTILSLLTRYPYLRSSHFYPLIGGKSRRRFIERLGVLYHEGGYVNRPARQ